MGIHLSVLSPQSRRWCQDALFVRMRRLLPPFMMGHVHAGYCSIRIHRRVEDGLRLHHDGSDGPQPRPAAGIRLTPAPLPGGLISWETNCQENKRIRFVCPLLQFPTNLEAPFLYIICLNWLRIRFFQALHSGLKGKGWALHQTQTYPFSIAQWLSRESFGHPKYL